MIPKCNKEIFKVNGRVSFEEDVEELVKSSVEVMGTESVDELLVVVVVVEVLEGGLDISFDEDGVFDLKEKVFFVEEFVCRLTDEGQFVFEELLIVE